MAMFYRKDIFNQYGITVPKTWDEYRAAGEKSTLPTPPGTSSSRRLIR